jgi:hypothetical protein
MAGAAAGFDQSIRPTRPHFVPADRPPKVLPARYTFG